MATNQCGEELLLRCDPKYEDELCDEHGYFTMYCILKRGHSGSHHTGNIVFPDIPERIPCDD